MFVDSHCHIDGEAFEADVEAVVARAGAAGVDMMLTVGTGNPHKGEISRAVELAERFDNVYAAVGVHPHDATLYNDDAERRLEDLINSSKKVVAWGEIGLDHYYDHSPREIQAEVFRRQIRKAFEYQLPIIIHTREADEETAEILTDECSTGKFAGGIMHCFGGSPDMAQQMMELGFYISFAGNVTFKKAENLREAASVVPLERLLIETDCPYLAPVPMRGKRNEPAFVAHTAGFLAELYKISIDELAEATTNNFKKLFEKRLAV